MKEVETTIKDGKSLPLRKAQLSDETCTIPVTLFAELVNEVEENRAYKFLYFKVSKYMSVRLLKSTERSVVQVLEDHNYTQPTLSINTQKCLSNVQIVSVNSKSFNIKYSCFICKAEVKYNDAFIECQECENIFPPQKCSKSSLVNFTVEVDTNKSQSLSCQLDLLEKCFGVTVQRKNILINKMIYTPVEITYDTVDNSVLQISTVNEDRNEDGDKTNKDINDGETEESD